MVQMKNTEAIDTLKGYVGLFFVVEESLLLHTCTLAEAEKGGDFLIIQRAMMIVGRGTIVKNIM
jgi:hypothetical protein